MSRKNKNKNKNTVNSVQAINTNQSRENENSNINTDIDDISSETAQESITTVNKEDQNTTKDDKAVGISVLNIEIIDLKDKNLKLMNDLEEYEKRIKDSKEEKVLLKYELEKAKIDLSRVEETVKIKDDETKAALDEKCDVEGKLLAERDKRGKCETQIALFKSEIDGLNERIDSLKKENELLNEDVKKYKMQADNCKDVFEKLKLKEKIIDKKYEDYEKVLDKANVEDIEELIIKCRAYEDEIENKQKKLQELCEELVNKNIIINSYKNLEIENVRKDKDIQFYKDELEKLKIDNIEYKKMNETIEKLRKAESSLQLREVELKSKEDENEVLKQKNFELSKDVSENGRLHAELSFYIMKYNRLNTELNAITKAEKEMNVQEELALEGLFSILKGPADKDKDLAFVDYPGDKEVYTRIQSILSNCGFNFNDYIIRSFLASLRSTRFMILKGFSGTGKSSLPKIICKALGGVCKVIPVQPNWKSKVELIGFFNHFNGKFIPTEFTRTLFEAGLERNKDRIYFVVLDEMNLSHVEYYFSDFNTKLGQEESEQYIELFENEIELTSEDMSRYIIEGRKIRIPQNVFFVGTINEDGSTKDISDKIYDRAQVIDFFEIKDGYPGDIRKIEDMKINPVKFQSFKDSFKFSYDAQDIKKVKELVYSLNSELKEKLSFNIGHRPQEQIFKFVKAYLGMGNSLTNEAIDMQLISKLLPKIKYSQSNNPEKAINELIQWLDKNWDGYYSASKFKNRLEKLKEEII